MASEKRKPLRLIKDGVETEELVFEGRGRLRMRKAAPGTISDEQVQAFFAALADTCNVVRSADIAGFSANWAYRKRKTDAGFRAGWLRAVAEGYAKLELVLLDRAMNGMVKRVPSGSGEKRIREYPNQLAMALLKRHSETAASIDNMLSEEEADEVRERILAKLVKRRERDERDERENRDGAAGDERG